MSLSNSTTSQHDVYAHDDPPLSSFEYMYFPGEIRNNIYDCVSSRLSQHTMIIALMSLAFVNVLIHRELISQNVSGISYVVTSMLDIWYFNMLLDMCPDDSVLRKVTELTINDFTLIAHS